MGDYAMGLKAETKYCSVRVPSKLEIRPLTPRRNATERNGSLLFGTMRVTVYPFLLRFHQMTNNRRKINRRKRNFWNTRTPTRQVVF